MRNKYKTDKAVYVPFVGGASYPPWSQEYVRVGWCDICPTLSARDYKDPKVVCVDEY